MSPSLPLLRTVLTTASAAALALTVGLFPGGPAVADSPEPSATATATQSPVPGDCEGNCGSSEEDRKPPETAGPQKPAGQAPAPAPPAPAAPAPDPSVPAAPQVPAPAEVQPEEPVLETATPEASTAAPSSPAATPSNTSNWNTPVTRSALATQVAAVSAAGGADGDPALLPIIAGLLLLGAAGVSFAWWGWNRRRAH